MSPADARLVLSAAALAGGYAIAALVLLTRARVRNRAANAYFALFLLALAAFSYADAAELLFEYQLTGWTNVFPYATMSVFAGCFTLAVAHFVTPERRPRYADALWLLPPLFTVLVAWGLFGADLDRVFDETLLRRYDESPVLLVAEMLNFGVCVAAWAYALVRVRRHRSIIRDLRSDAELADLRWLRNVLLATPVLLLV